MKLILGLVLLASSLSGCTQFQGPESKEEACDFVYTAADDALLETSSNPNFKIYDFYNAYIEKIVEARTFTILSPLQKDMESYLVALGDITAAWEISYALVPDDEAEDLFDSTPKYIAYEETLDQTQRELFSNLNIFCNEQEG